MTPNQAMPIRPIDGAQDLQQAHDPKPIGPEYIEGQRTAFPACVYILR